MRLLVCGGRSYVDSLDRMTHIYDTLSALKAPDILIVGGDGTYKQDDKSVDGCAYRWASSRGIPTAVVRAYWERWDRAAGPIRNAAMLHLQPDLVIAFPGGKGTDDMARRAEARGVEVRRIDPI